MENDDYFPKVEEESVVVDDKNDKKRYIVGLQDIKDKSCYKDSFWTNKLEDSKVKALGLMQKYNRATIVFDRQSCPAIIHRETLQIQEQPIVATETPKKRGRKRK